MATLLRLARVEETFKFVILYAALLVSVFVVAGWDVGFVPFSETGRR